MSCDPIYEIVEICRDAITAGLIKEPKDRFETQLHLLHGDELEDYLQTIWDEI